MGEYRDLAATSIVAVIGSTKVCLQFFDRRRHTYFFSSGQASLALTHFFLREHSMEVTAAIGRFTTTEK
jgi:hypothetical protein